MTLVSNDLLSFATSSILSLDIFISLPSLLLLFFFFSRNRCFLRSVWTCLEPMRIVNSTTRLEGLLKTGSGGIGIVQKKWKSLCWLFFVSIHSRRSVLEDWHLGRSPQCTPLQREVVPFSNSLLTSKSSASPSIPRQHLLCNYFFFVHFPVP